MAAHCGTTQTLSFYIERGYIELGMGDTSQPKWRGYRALHLVVQKANDECVRILLAKGPNRNSRLS